MKVRLLVAAFVATICVFMNVPQSFTQAVAGRIVGTVHDAQGAVIPGVSVFTKNLETGAGADRTFG